MVKIIGLTNLRRGRRSDFDPKNLFRILNKTPIKTQPDEKMRKILKFLLTRKFMLVYCCGVELIIAVTQFISKNLEN